MWTLCKHSQDDKEGGEKRAKVDDSLSASDLIQHLVTQVTTASPVQDFMALLRGEAPNFNDSKLYYVETCSHTQK